MNEFLINFHLIRPWWLLAIMPALVIFVLLLKASQTSGQWYNFIPPHLAALLIDGKAASNTIYPRVTLFVIWLIAIVALAGPSWQKLPQPLFKVNSAQIVVMDMSLSMYATDIKPNRVTRARFKVTDLINQFEEGETGLVAYAGDAFVISPMTEDVNNLLNLLPSLAPEIMPVYGSAPASGIESALTLFEQTGKVRGDIYLVTDGISQQDHREIANLLANKDFRLHVLAIGAAIDAPIKLPNGELLKDSDGNIVLPALKTGPLISLAKQFDGRYAQISADNSDIDYLSSTDNQFEDGELSQNKPGDSWHEEGPWLLLLVLPFVALAFRKGVIVSLVIMTTATLSPVIVTTPAMAASEPLASQPDPQSAPAAESVASDNAGNSWWQGLWQTDNQQAIEQFNAGNFANAASSFEDQRWQGASHYKNGDYEAALSAFSQNDDPDSTYNQGNALMQLQRYDEAISRYKKVLAQQPDYQGVQENLELAEKLKAQQEQQKQEQQGGESDEQSDEKKQQDQHGESPSDDQNKNGQDSEGENDSSSEQEPSADKESSADQEPSGSDNQSSSQQEPSANDKEPLAGEKETSANEKDSSADEKDATDHKNEPSEDDGQQATQKNAPLFDDKDLTKEQRQRLNQLAKKVADDPSLLLRNKMALEARKRRNLRIIKKDNVNW